MEFRSNIFFSCKNATTSRLPGDIGSLKGEEKYFWDRLVDETSDYSKLKSSETLFIPLKPHDCPYFGTTHSTVNIIKIQRVATSWSVRGTLIDPIKVDGCMVNTACRLDKHSILRSSNVRYNGCNLIKIKTYPCMIYRLNKGFKILVQPQMYDIGILDEQAFQPVCQRDNVLVLMSESGMFFSLDRKGRDHPFCLLKRQSEKEYKQCPLQNVTLPLTVPVLTRIPRSVTSDVSVVPLSQKLDWVFSHHLLDSAHATAIRNSMINKTLADLYELEYRICQNHRQNRILAESLSPLDPFPLLSDLSGGKGFLYKQSGKQILFSYGRTMLVNLRMLMDKTNNYINIEGDKCYITGSIGITRCGFPGDTSENTEPLEILPLAQGGSYNPSTQKFIQFDRHHIMKLSSLENQISENIPLYVEYSSYELNTLENSGILASDIPTNIPNSESFWDLIAQSITGDTLIMRILAGISVYLAVSFLLSLFRLFSPEKGGGRRRGLIF